MINTRNSDWKSTWHIRRRFMFVISAFCMWTISFVLWKDLTSGPADTAITMSFLTLIGIVGSYVFGATWEDVSLARISTKSSKPASALEVKNMVEDMP